VASQLVTVDFASVPTSLTTPVGAIRTATDGVNLANVMTFLENGNVGLGTDTAGSKFDVHSAGAIVAQFNKTGTGNSYIQQLLAGAAKWKHGFTTATGAFDIIDDVNALTRLSVLNTGQLKLNAYTSTSAFTGTTAGFLAFDASGNILSVTSPATSPAGTTGAVQFNNAGAFGADSTNFFWDDTNNRLGIGTNAPTAIINTVSTSASIPALTANGISGSAQPVLRINSSATGTYLWAASMMAANMAATNNNFYFIGKAESTNNAAYFGYNHTADGSASNFATMGLFGVDNVLNITAANRVGIGTTSPTAKLQVVGSGSTSATTSLLVQNSAAATVLEVFDNRTIKVNGGTGNGITVELNGSLEVTSQAYLRGQNYGQSGFFAGINSGESPRAIIQADSTTKGFLPPRMTTAQKNAIATPPAGLMVYDTTLNKLCVYTTAWETITSI
jgi:hypothetical protein